MAPKLVYFPIAGRAGCIRDAFKLGKIEFEDVHVTFEQFKEKKAAGEYTLGALPVLILDDGTQVTQSNAILRWVGKQANLYPTDATQALYVDEVMDAAEDGYHLISPSIHESDEEKKMAMRKELVEGKFQAYLKGLATLAARNGDNGYFVGSDITVADLKMAPFLAWITKGILDGFPTTLLDGFPGLQKIVASYNTKTQ